MCSKNSWKDPFNLSSNVYSFASLRTTCYTNIVDTTVLDSVRLSDAATTALAISADRGNNFFPTFPEEKKWRIDTVRYPRSANVTTVPFSSSSFHEPRVRFRVKFIIEFNIFFFLLVRNSRGED